MAHGEIFLQLSVKFPDDPKVRSLARFGRNARPARDLYVQMLCYCKDNLTDGFVPAEQIGIMTYPDSPAVGRKDAALLVEVGLVTVADGGWLVPGFLKRNKSRDAVKNRAEEKKRAGSKANHVRWHVERGERKPDCEWCQDGSGDDPKSDPGRDPGTDQTSDHPSDPTGIHRDRVIGQSHRSETESVPSDPTSSSPRPPDPATDEPLAPPPAEAQPDEDDEDRELDELNSRIEGRIIELLNEHTGRTVDRGWAARVRRQILDDRDDITNPLGYVASCIRGEPLKFVPPQPEDQLGAAVIAEVRSADLGAVADAARRGAAAARAALPRKASS